MSDLLTRLRAPLSMSMFRNASDLAAEALIQRREAREAIEMLLSALKPFAEPCPGCGDGYDHAAVWMTLAATHGDARSASEELSPPATPAQGDRLAGERQRVKRQNPSLQGSSDQ